MQRYEVTAYTRKGFYREVVEAMNDEQAWSIGIRLLRHRFRGRRSKALNFQIEPIGQESHHEYS